MSAAPPLALVPPVTRRGRPARPVLAADANAHAGRPWPPADREAARLDAAKWSRAFRRVAPCQACLWPLATPCPHRGGDSAA